MFRKRRELTSEEFDVGISILFMHSLFVLVSILLGAIILIPLMMSLEFFEAPEVVMDVVLIVYLLFVCFFANHLLRNWFRKHAKKKRAAFQAAKRLEEILQPAIAHVDTKVPSDIMQHCERLRGDNEALERELRRYRAEGRIDDTDAIMLIRVYASRRKKNKESSERLAAVFGGTYGIEEY